MLLKKSAKQISPAMIKINVSIWIDFNNYQNSLIFKYTIYTNDIAIAHARMMNNISVTLFRLLSCCIRHTGIDKGCAVHFKTAIVLIKANTAKHLNK
jgi:hypothetical protein